MCPPLIKLGVVDEYRLWVLPAATGTGAPLFPELDQPLTLADDVVFRSPVASKPYQGKAITAAILRGVLRVFEDFRYVRELSGEGGRDHALVFQAGIGDVAVESDLIDEFTVMVRPLSAAQTLADAMAAQFEQIQREATVG